MVQDHDEDVRALVQAQEGSPEQRAKGQEALIEFRRKLYAILADDDTQADQ